MNMNRSKTFLYIFFTYIYEIFEAILKCLNNDFCKLKNSN